MGSILQTSATINHYVELGLHKSKDKQCSNCNRMLWLLLALLGGVLSPILVISDSNWKYHAIVKPSMATSSLCFCVWKLIYFRNLIVVPNSFIIIFITQYIPISLQWPKTIHRLVYTWIWLVKCHEPWSLIFTNIVVQLFLLILLIARILLKTTLNLLTFNGPHTSSNNNTRV